MSKLFTSEMQAQYSALFAQDICDRCGCVFTIDPAREHRCNVRWALRNRRRGVISSLTPLVTRYGWRALSAPARPKVPA